MMRGKITRRRLLKAATGACALPYLVSTPALGQGDAVAASERITMACIGLGGRGKENLRSFMGHRDCRIVAVCDVNANRLAEAQRIVNEHYGDAGCAIYRRLSGSAGPGRHRRRIDCHAGRLARAAIRRGRPGGQGHLS